MSPDDYKLHSLKYISQDTHKHFNSLCDAILTQTNHESGRSAVLSAKWSPFASSVRVATAN